MGIFYQEQKGWHSVKICGLADSCSCMLPPQEQSHQGFLLQKWV